MSTDRVNLIMQSEIYLRAYHKITKLEETRIFCRHNISHFLDVARLAYIESLESGGGVSKDLIYAASLLHDIGRFMEYIDGTPHEKASLPIAQEILEACDYTKEEQNMILTAIELHRNQEESAKYPLAKLIYDADKRSRSCFCCEAVEQCSKREDKRNQSILA